MKRSAIGLVGMCTLALVSCSGDNTSLSREAAGRKVVEQLVDDDDPTIVFSHAELVDAGSSLLVGMPERLGDRTSIPIESQAWFFWIDDEPGARFDHPTRFVLVDRESGALTVHEAAWWPILDGQPLWTATADYWDDENWVFGSESGRRGVVALPEPAMAEPCQPGFGTALVFNGHGADESGGEDFAADATNMTSTLEGLGFDVTNAGTTGTPGVALGKEQIDQWFAEKAAQLGPGDNLVIYITGHGSTVSPEHAGILGQGEAGGLYSHLLAQQLAKFNPGVEIIVIVDSCHSGAMLADLNCVADLAISAARDDQSSYGDIDDSFLSLFGGGDVDADDTGGEFTSALSRSMRELVEDPTERARLEDAADNDGGSFMRSLLTDAGLRERMYDLAYQRGWSEPQFRDGAVKTRPTIGDPTAPVCNGDPGDTDTDTDTEGAEAESGSESTTSDTDPSACDNAELGDLSQLLGDILGADVGTAVCDGAEPLPEGNPVIHSDGADESVAEEEVDWRFRGTILGVDLPGDVPCGSGNGYDVLCTGATLPLDGPVAIFYGLVAADIDIAEPTYSYQYGVVLDTDGDPSNDYQPQPAYPADFFAGTDRWFYTVHPAGEDWYTWSSSADAGFANVPSSMRFVISGDAVVLIVDEDEITPKSASWRMTAFRHLGDYGLSMPWSGDVVPPVGEPLTPVQ